MISNHGSLVKKLDELYQKCVEKEKFTLWGAIERRTMTN
jgi:hypothetical protein